jgi:hypothetical protein
MKKTNPSVMQNLHHKYINERRFSFFQIFWAQEASKSAKKLKGPFLTKKFQLGVKNASFNSDFQISRSGHNFCCPLIR